MGSLLSPRRLLLVTVSTLCVVAAAVYALDRALEAIIRAPVNSYLRDRTLGLMQTEASEGLTIDLPVLDLSLFRRRVLLRDVAIRYDRKKDQETLHLDAHAGRVTLDGLDLSDLIWRRNFRLSGVSLQDVALRHRQDSPPDSTKPDKATTFNRPDSLSVLLPAPDSLLFEVVAGWLPKEISGGRIDRLRIQRATVVSQTSQGDRQTLDSTAGLDLTIIGLELDSARQRIFERGTLEAALFLHATPGRGDSLIAEHTQVSVGGDDTTITVARFRTGPDGVGHAVQVVGFNRSQARHIVTADTLVYGPLLPDSAFFRRAPPRSTSSRVVATGIRMLGLEQHDLLKRSLPATGIWVDSLDIDVTADRRTPGGPPSRRVLWPVRFAAFDWVAGSESLTVERGRIRYAELIPGTAQPLAIEFDRVHGVATNITNDTAKSGPGRPVTLVAQGRLLRAAPVRLRLDVVVAPGPLTMKGEGRIGEMQLDALNPLLLPALGLRLTNGQLHRADFEFTVGHGKSVGRFLATWEELRVEMVNRSTKKQGLGDKLKTLVARLMVRDDHMPDKKGNIKASTIKYTIDPSDTFWGLVWRSVRSGLIKAARGEEGD